MARNYPAYRPTLTGPRLPGAEAGSLAGHAATGDTAGDEAGSDLAYSQQDIETADEHSHPSGSETGQPAAQPAPVPPAPTLIEAGELLRALAAPVRIGIVLQLREAPRCVHELVESLGVTQPLISQHLRVLKEAGVVSGRRQGREVIYRLVDEHLAHIVVDAVAHARETTETEKV